MNFKLVLQRAWVAEKYTLAKKLSRLLWILI